MKSTPAWLLAVLAAGAVMMGSEAVFAKDEVEVEEAPGKSEEVGVKEATAEGYSRTKFMAKRNAMGIVKRRTKGRFRVLSVDYEYNRFSRSKWTCTVRYEYWD